MNHCLVVVVVVGIVMTMMMIRLDLDVIYHPSNDLLRIQRRFKNGKCRTKVLLHARSYCID